MVIAPLSPPGGCALLIFLCVPSCFCVRLPASPCVSFGIRSSLDERCSCHCCLFVWCRQPTAPRRVRISQCVALVLRVSIVFSLRILVYPLASGFHLMSVAAVIAVCFVVSATRHRLYGTDFSFLLRFSPCFSFLLRVSPGGSLRLLLSPGAGFICRLLHVCAVCVILRP